MVQIHSPHIEVFTSLLRSHISSSSTWPSFLKGSSSPKSSFAYGRHHKPDGSFASDQVSDKERLTKKKHLDTADQEYYELSPNKGTIDTFVGGGQRHRDEPFTRGGDRIHLKSEIIQERVAAVDAFKMV